MPVAPSEPQPTHTHRNRSNVNSSFIGLNTHIVTDRLKNSTVPIDGEPTGNTSKFEMQEWTERLPDDPHPGLDIL